MPKHAASLEIDRCPHCGVARPHLEHTHQLDVPDPLQGNTVIRSWVWYKCTRCGKLVSAWSWADNQNREIEDYYPSIVEVSADIPNRPAEYLRQALESLHAPSGAILLSASAVDAMLKEKDYREGSLYSRINEAVRANLITTQMEQWAHEVRLDANDERHADEEQTMPVQSDGERTVEFALALAEYLFVLPAKVQRGITPQ